MATTKKASWTMCHECKGGGKKKRRISKKAKNEYQAALDAFNKSNGPVPVQPKATYYACKDCNRSGLLQADRPPKADRKNYPHIAIIGGGIGGVALAVACLHRGIPFTLYERDRSFNERSQGYGLTLQQASKALAGLGIRSLEEGIISTRHVVHTTDGNIIGEWGMRKWQDANTNKPRKRSNIHIARQSLRLALLAQLGKQDVVQWGYQLIDYKISDAEGVELSFEVNGKTKQAKTDLVVGADGIHSTVRQLLLGTAQTPLRYLDCIVILGICPLSALEGIESPLLDSATVFQTANGNERIYMMPYSSDTIMWQLSFPLSEKEAKELSSKGSQALKEEASKRTQWHAPIPQIVAATQAELISGYPVYDRALLTPQLLQKEKQITLIGDAVHPMSPFKGQGANQALLDALSLAREITHGCRPLSNWRKEGIRKSALNQFESEMLARSATKVKDSAAAATFLHSDIVLHESNEPRGNNLKKKDS